PRHPDPFRGRLDADPAAHHRSDVGLPGARSQGDRALRRGLSARLPRGRGDRARRAPPAQARGGADQDAAARGRPIVDRAVFVRLLHGQGAARALRRHVPAVHDAPGGEMTPLKVSIAASIASVVLLLVVFELIRSRRLRERYALLWLLTGVVLLVLPAWPR